MQNTKIKEKIQGIVERVTYHNESNGWSVLKVSSFRQHGELITVTVHQTKVFAGATMEFRGSWTYHSRFGKQFKAVKATELKPANSAAIEKYLGSGLIKGVGPKTAKKIVKHFGKQTLEIFEKRIDALQSVPGIAHKKLKIIKDAWVEHREIREVMMFLQSHGISTLFAVRIYKQYGDAAIAIVSSNPYRLAIDFYGIGFFTADRIALKLGYQADSDVRIVAAISHVLSASRESGDCYLTEKQVSQRVNRLLELNVAEKIAGFLHYMEQEGQLRVRYLEQGDTTACYYSKSIFYDEEYVAQRISMAVSCKDFDFTRTTKWIDKYSGQTGINLSSEQKNAVSLIVNQHCSVLTGGPGCGKTTTTRFIVELLKAMDQSVMLAAPTGRAAQRMGEVIGMPAKTIHRLLDFQGNGFKKDEGNPLQTDFLIIDECSMLDISLAASLLKAVSPTTSLLFIGDADQLPSVGAGNVLKDIIKSDFVPCFKLTTIFRQAKQSAIIAAAHQINKGDIPKLESPFKKPEVWGSTDCFFVDSDEATKKQISFVSKVKQIYQSIEDREGLCNVSPFVYSDDNNGEYESFNIPEEYQHVSLTELITADSASDQLLTLAQKTHPWSSLYYGLTALDVVRKMYTEWIPKYLGKNIEIQVLSPMIRGTLGTANMNLVMQANVNPPDQFKNEIEIGERIFRQGDRVIHRRNNYDLNVFNGDIGIIKSIDNTNLSLTVFFHTENRTVEYNREQITELELAYGITIHKSQGSEFDVVIIPILSQHFTMLFRNLLYTGITRGKKLVVLVGTRKALAMAVKNCNTSLRQTALCHLLKTVKEE